LKQSQSAHFFENKNSGKEFFDEDVVKSTKAPIKQKVRGRQRGRSKFRNVNNANSVTSAPPRSAQTVASTQKTFTEQQTRQTFTNTPIVVQPVLNNRFEYENNNNNNFRSNNSTSLQSSNNHRAFAHTSAPQTTAIPQIPKRDETFFDVPKVNPKTQTTKLKSAPAQNFDFKPQPQPSSTASPQVPAGFPFLGAIPQRVIIPSKLSPEQRLALQASNANVLQSTAASISSPSTTPNPQFVPQFSRVSPNPNQLRQNNEEKFAQKDLGVLPQKFNFKTQKYESAEPLHPTTQFYNPNYETKGTDQPFNSNINIEPTRSGLSRQNSSKTFSQRQSTTLSRDESKPTTFNPQQYYQSEQSQYQNLSPRGFSLAAQKQQELPAKQIQLEPVKQFQPEQAKQFQPELRPQITSRSEARTHKKFSTLVPKDQYNPTTFKPNNNFSKKPVDQYASQKLEKIQNSDKYYSQFTSAQTTQSTTTVTVNTTPHPQTNNFHNQHQFQHNNNFQQSNNFQQQSNNNFEQSNNFQHQTTRQSNYFSSTTTARPLADGEEDDGLYRPELYEKDFYRNKAKTTKITPAPVRNTFNNFYQTTSTTFKPQNQNNFNSGDEDELFKTAHSQNIFASGNALRAEKEREKTVVKYNDYSTTITEKSSPRPFSKPTPPVTQLKTTASVATTKSSKKTTKPRREKIEKDVSYDYQYYDTNADQNDYSELETIEEFGKTSKKSSSN
jgi:hypothetical protein